MPISQEFLCKCGKMKSWITEGKHTPPCPECGKKYYGVYNKKKYSIDVREVKE